MPKQLKRPNNAGSVYKLSGRRRNPWAASVSKGYGKSGKRMRELIGCYETKSEALKALAKYDIFPVSRPSITLGQMYKEWSAVKYPKISKSTADNYRAAYNRLSPLYSYKFKDLRTAHYQSIIDSNADKLSRSSLEKIRGLLSLLCKYGLMNDISSKNYAEFITLPRSEYKEKERFTELNVQKLIDNDSSHVVKIILTMIFTGFRPSAALSLTRFNYDPEHRVLRGGIKTEAGFNRPVPVHSQIQKYIDYFLSLDGDTILCNPQGRPYTLANFRDKHYYPALEKLDLPRLTPHRCRHTFISLLQTNDAAKVAVLKLGGHTDYGFSSNTYSHLEMDKLRNEVEKIIIGG